jgi:hypothetical protein
MLTSTAHIDLKYIVEDLIHQKEKHLGHKLSEHDEDFLIMTCTNFTLDNIHKFVTGAKEHADDGGDFITSVNHKRELYLELLDAINYLKAMEYK